jgi:hypothetical protein
MCGVVKVRILQGAFDGIRTILDIAVIDTALRT